ncbi:ABC transporter permease [Leifsonia shinshuensis]|uniref:ABC-type spermidine/putrescine transport system permease subunit II n=2 Tax=Leifsonia shinshuensis TaxID=150026 RepID=A0A853CYT5_9MICO|nr:ABC transporter permease [Leifsonia shinshuensis]NYJ25718.1 ABC-type spermidine/putrescine transport system permease subunit II [Leifsonia shinshuensis]
MKTAALPRLMKIWLYVVLVVLALPLVSMLVLSLNQSRYGTFPFHFTLDWYATLGNDTALIGALETSLNLATQATIFAVVVGTLLSLGMARSRIYITVPINSLLLALLTVPALILAAGFVMVFAWFGLGSSSVGLILASIVTSVPFVVLLVSGRLKELNPHYAEAAHSLGAGPVRTFLTITIPLIAPSIIAGAMLAFVITFNNFAIQLFLAPIGVSTLPVQIYSMVRLGVTPDVDALATIIILSTVLLVVILNWLSGNAAKLFTTSTNKGN